MFRLNYNDITLNLTFSYIKETENNYDEVMGS